MTLVDRCPLRQREPRPKKPAFSTVSTIEDVRRHEWAGRHTDVNVTVIGEPGDVYVSSKGKQITVPQGHRRIVVTANNQDDMNNFWRVDNDLRKS